MINFFTNYKSKKFYSKLIDKEDLCFDIGANIGKKSELILSIGAKVIAFEPQSQCFDKLEILKNKFLNFEFYPYGIGSQNEEKELHLATHIEVATFSDEFIEFYSNETIQWNKKEIVSVKTLDSMIEKYGVPNYCKIDTEGYELKILSSLTYKIPMIEFEFTESHFDETLEIIDLFDSEKTTFNFILNENLKFKLKKWVSGNELKEQLKTLLKNKLHGNIFAKTDD
ncbi:FkbM family methyltransferase [Flavobacterium gelidilacus]|uniref:FkbM family methyltransferase n=1 Tax=Flavobacterium gelidilacus TaxID=206041 RepID=UPI0004141EC0|nr:FkbM family methyltransferase [Flavobacterium gelidilacus]